MGKKNRDGQPVIKTGRDVINFASENGAKISQGKSGRVIIETDQGKMHVFDNTRQYDKKTIHNIYRWLKLLGLLSAIGGIFWFFQNFHIIW